MDSEIGSIDMTDITVDASVPGFLSRVEKYIQSEISSMANSGIPNRDFTSAVDSAIRSNTTAPNFGASHIHSFSSAVNNAMRSTCEGAELVTSHVHSFASRVDNAIKTDSPKVSDLKGSVQLVTMSELVAATNNFSLDNMIGAGSFGVVYRAKLVDGREVAIKQGETGSETGRIFLDYELIYLSRLHHKHLVGIVGFCGGEDKKVFLVNEYMKNGSLYDHLHDKSSIVLNNWKMRINIALDASLGIEYLHNHAVPSIIHRDIKSCNILFDANWTAKLCDFGLMYMKKTAGTIGYIDPEYYDLTEWTVRGDVYGLGVVLLELLTGKKAIFENGKDGGTQLSLVEFAVPAILAKELVNILDARVGAPDVNEAEALELMAYTAIHCVNLEGNERPTIAPFVINLGRALAICDSSPNDSISSGTIPIVLPTKKNRRSFCCFNPRKEAR